MSQTLAIADSSALFRLGVRNMSRQIEGIEVVGEASCGEDLIGLFRMIPSKDMTSEASFKRRFE